MQYRDTRHPDPHPRNPWFSKDEDPYFWWCEACKCFEYDCHGYDGCVTHEPGYQNPHIRNRR
jgi:hypothetical protein